MCFEKTKNKSEHINREIFDFNWFYELILSSRTKFDALKRFMVILDKTYSNYDVTPCSDHGVKVNTHTNAICLIRDEKLAHNSPLSSPLRCSHCQRWFSLLLLLSKREQICSEETSNSVTIPTIFILLIGLGMIITTRKKRGNCNLKYDYRRKPSTLSQSCQTIGALFCCRGISVLIE